MAYVDEDDSDDLDSAVKGGLAGLLPFGEADFDLHVARVFPRDGFKGKFYAATGTVLKSTRRELPVGSRWALLFKRSEDKSKRAMFLRPFGHLVSAISGEPLEGGALNEAKKALFTTCEDETFDLGQVVRCIQTVQKDRKGQIDPNTKEIKEYTNRDFIALGELSAYGQTAAA